MVTWLLAAAAFAEPAGLEAVQVALSHRHPVPCDEVLALTETPVETLLHVVDHTPMPPWSPMRAAQCLLEHHPTEIEERLAQWVSDPALRGLGRLTLARLDRLPEPVAARVARKAIDEGSEPDRAREACAVSEHDAVRALVRPAE